MIESEHNIDHGDHCARNAFLSPIAVFMAIIKPTNQNSINSMHLNISLSIADVHHQTELLLAYTRVLQMKDDADVVDIIMRRRLRRTTRRSNL